MIIYQAQEKENMFFEFYIYVLFFYQRLSLVVLKRIGLFISYYCMFRIYLYVIMHILISMRLK